MNSREDYVYSITKTIQLAIITAKAPSYDIVKVVI